MLNVNLIWFVTESVPTQASQSPRNAAVIPLKTEPFERPTTMVMAMRQRLKYSQGPSFNAISAIYVEQSVATMMEMKVPMKEPVIPMESAFAAFPFLVMG